MSRKYFRRIFIREKSLTFPHTPWKSTLSIQTSACLPTKIQSSFSFIVTSSILCEYERDEFFQHQYFIFFILGYQLVINDLQSVHMTESCANDGVFMKRDFKVWIVDRFWKELSNFPKVYRWEYNIVLLFGAYSGDFAKESEMLKRIRTNKTDCVSRARCFLLI